MKKIISSLPFIALCLCTLMPACSNEEPDDLMRIFIDKDYTENPNEIIPQNYHSPLLEHEDIYTAVFEKDSPLSLFEPDEHLRVEYGTENAPYVTLKELGRDNYYYWTRNQLPSYNPREDFEVEIEFSCNLNEWKNDEWIGVVVNRASKHGQYFFQINNSSGGEKICVYNLNLFTSKLENLFEQRLTLRPPHTYRLTVRKYNKEICFFLNKRCLFSTKYAVNNDIFPRTGFSLPYHPLARTKITKWKVSKLVSKPHNH